MEQDITLDYRKPSEKVYKDREIWVGALLGGTLAAGYMVAANYKAFGEADKRRKTWFVTIAATAFLFYILLFAPFVDRLPHQLFSLVCAGLIVVSARLFQGEKIAAHIRAGGRVQSWWKTLGVSIVGGVVVLAMFASASYIADAVESANFTSKTYGTIQNEIYYDRRNISETEVDALADASIKSNLFFDNRSKWYAYARKVNTDYEISVSLTRAAINDGALLKFFNEERGYIQARFPNNKIIINLVEGNFNKIEKRIE